MEESFHNIRFKKNGDKSWHSVNDFEEFHNECKPEDPPAQSEDCEFSIKT
jgi:hypothetical protein